MKNRKATISGVGMLLPHGLLIMFIYLKLGHVIEWPWVWVLSPFWIYLIVFVIYSLINAILHEKRKK